MSTDTTIERERKIKTVDVTPVWVEPDDTLVFTNDSTKYPKFEIKFVGPSPASPGDKLEGTKEVRIHVATHGDFNYKVRHFTKENKFVEAGPFGVRSCIGGCSG
jgi:hypothetical protein